MVGTITAASLLWLFVQGIALFITGVLKLRSCRRSWYCITWETKALNRAIYGLGRRHHARLCQLYTAGIPVALMLGISATVLLMRELLQLVKWADQVSFTSGRDQESFALMLAIPGITVPWSHTFYLWVAIAISVGFHEAGHALAATTEGVGVHYVAGFILFLVPGALVALDTDTLAILNPAKTLKIICAGVWHNAILCMLCWALALFLPALLSPFYSVGNGAVVRSLAQSGPLSGHLKVSDVITMVDSCVVTDSADWLNCLTRMSIPLDHELNANKSGFASNAHYTRALGGGHCVPHNQLADTEHTCSSSSDCQNQELCFQNLDRLPDNSSFWRGNTRKSLKQRSLQSDDSESQRNKSSVRLLTAARNEPKNDSAVMSENALCLNARRVVQMQQCGKEGATTHCPEFSSCFVHLPSSSDKLLKVCYRKMHGASVEERRNSTASSDFGNHVIEHKPSMRIDTYQPDCPDFVLFFGRPDSLLQAIETADFSPNLRWIPMDLPFALKQLLEYIFAVSAALALLNMAPIFGLDGKAALESLIDIFSIESNDLSRGRGRCSWQRSAVLVQNSLICLGSVVFCFILTVNIARVAGYDTALIRLVVLVRHVLTFSLRFG